MGVCPMAFSNCGSNTDKGRGASQAALSTGEATMPINQVLRVQANWTGRSRNKASNNTNACAESPHCVTNNQN